MRLMYNLKDIWESQSADSAKVSREAILTRSEVQVFAATNNTTSNHLIIVELTTNSSRVLSKLETKFRGVSVHYLIFDNHSEVIFALLDNNLKDIFILFSQNLIEEIEKRSSHIDNAIDEVVYRWKILFEKFRSDILTEEQQRGLFGELYLMKTLLDSGIPSERIVGGWEGPLREDKDFLFNSVEIEVKTSSAKHATVRVSSERQLDSPLEGKLILFYIALDKVKTKSLSLVSLVDEIRRMIASARLTEAFEQKLLKAGYKDEDTDSYLTSYSIRLTQAYCVTSGFPKIIRQQIHPGIFDVSYTIELSACEPYKIIESELLRQVSNG